MCSDIITGLSLINFFSVSRILMKKLVCESMESSAGTNALAYLAPTVSNEEKKKRISGADVKKTFFEPTNGPNKRLGWVGLGRVGSGRVRLG
jgi:hypothetical protein